MRTARAILLLLALTIPWTSPRAADSRSMGTDDSAVAKGVLELLGHLEIDTVGDELFAMMVAQVMPMMRRKVPDLPDDAYAKLHEEMARTMRAGTPELLTANVSLYREHLTPEDVAAINTFYATTAGRKMLEVLPGLMRQSYYMGQEWVERMKREAERRWMARMKREGYLK